MAETERSGLLVHRTTSPVEPIANGKLDNVGEEDTGDASRQEKVHQLLSHAFMSIMKHAFI